MPRIRNNNNGWRKGRRCFGIYLIEADHAALSAHCTEQNITKSRYVADLIRAALGKGKEKP